MGGLPTGTVTLVFSDMEGSTLLLSRLGDRYVEALDAQRAIQREAWTSHDGFELGTEGDSFFVAFSTAEHAVAAVTDAQRALARFPWPGDTAVRVRMGLHTGSPLPHDGAYVGIDVHRAARISAAAHGGQVVLSDATAGLVSRSLPTGVRLRDLGDHRFKDIQGPEHVFQLEVDGLPSQFPPLRSLGASSSLPTLDGALLGRQGELSSLRDLLDANLRLVTLTGPGGSGKTTLAIAFARSVIDRFPGGAYFVPLVAADDEDAMWSGIGEVLGLSTSDRNAAGVCGVLESRRSMLLLDNLEQLAAAADGVRRMLDAAPQLVVMATSRRPLHLHDEQEFDVGPLGLPQTGAVETAAASPSVRLFVEQSRRVRPSFELTADNVDDVVAICRRLDGMPLGIELAAARSRLLNPSLLLARLASALDLSAPAVDRPTRHHTLRDTIAWSYELLTVTQRAMFEDLGAFADGADLAAVSAVCEADIPPGVDPVDVLVDLVDASLARIVDDDFGEPRVVQLETIRAFGEECLAASTRGNVVRERHARHYAAVAHEAVDERNADTRRVMLERLESERDNHVAALEWAIGDDAPPEGERITLALGLLGNAGSQWISSSLKEGIAWTERGIERAGDRVDADVVRCLALLANMLRFNGDRERSHEYASRALAMARQLGGDVPAMAYVLRTMAISEFEVGQTDNIRALYVEAVDVARESGVYSALHSALWEAGWFEMQERDLERGRSFMEDALALAVSEGSIVDEVDTGHSLAKIVYLEGRVAEAEPLMRSGLRQAVSICDEFDLSASADDYAAVLAELGRHRDAVRLFGAVNAYYTAHDIERSRQDEVGTLPALDGARAALSADEWQAAYDEGAATPLRDALRAVVGASDNASLD